MTLTCKNCGQHYKGNFCHNCGQPASTHHLNWHFLWHDIQHGVFHFDKGLTYTTKELFSRPGHSIKEFIEGKRVKHFKPISLVLVCAGVFGLLFHFFHISMLESSVEVNGTDENAKVARNLIGTINEWISSHYAIVSLAQLPAYAIGTYLSFRKAGYNFIEHVVINAFLTAQRIMLRIALFPLYYVFSGTESMKGLGSMMNVINIILTVWAFRQIFNSMSNFSVVWRTILSFIISFAIFVTVVAIGFVAFGGKNLFK